MVKAIPTSIPGVLVVEPKVFGRVFINDPLSDYEDLEFVSRGE